MDIAVNVKKLVKRYGNIEAVKGISFTVEKGEIFGLIGPNGAGKTTTLQIDEGTVKILGFDCKKDADNVRKFISYLPVDAGAYKNLTGRKYLEFIANFFNPKQKQTYMKRGIEITDLDERIDDRVDSYSKGMIRRLLVGRALMINPRLAILDEPTSGLDVINAQEIRRIIKDTVKDGTAVLLSSHNMLEVEFMCDRIALIADGIVVETGRPKELMKKHKCENIEEVFTKVVS